MINMVSSKKYIGYRGFVSVLRTIVEIDHKVFDSILDSVRTALEEKQKKLIDLMFDSLIDKTNYDLKAEDLSSKILEKEKEIKDIQDQQIARKLFKDKLEAIREKILSKEYTVIAEQDVKYSFWTFDLQEDGSRRKKKMESFPIRVAIKK